jgi:PadR family transcriptional regulator PadR
MRNMKKEELNVLSAMLSDPIAWHYSLGIGTAAGIAPGTIYPTLARLERTGWIESGWDSKVEAAASRRRIYRLTGVGQRIAAEVLAECARDLSAPQTRRRFGFGLARPARGLV